MRNLACSCFPLQSKRPSGVWREYPIDQRGSYFRQFWDVSSFLAEEADDPDDLRERLRDIRELHEWAENSALGTHGNRGTPGDEKKTLVLVIRGELLKKFPAAVIYAHRAVWKRKETDNTIDKTQPRELAKLEAPVNVNPPPSLVKTPLFEAKVDPDIYFLGFDLTEEDARGGQEVNGEEDPGWFFVIKERPGEPRFGLDVARPDSQPHRPPHLERLSLDGRGKQLFAGHVPAIVGGRERGGTGTSTGERRSKGAI